MRKSRKAVIAFAAVAGMMTVMATPAQAAPTSDSQSAAQVQPSSVYVASASEAKVTSEGTFYPIPEDARDAVIVMPSVSEELDLKQGAFVQSADVPSVLEDIKKVESTPSVSVSNTPVVLAAQGRIGFQAFGGQTIRSSWSSAFIGSNWNVKKSYNVQVNINSNGNMSATGLGYRRGYNGSDFGVWETWTFLGTGKEAGRAVSWGAVSSKPSVKITGTGGLLGVYGDWI